MKRLPTSIEMESRAAVSHIRSEHEREDSEASRNFATYRAAIHSLVAEVRGSMSETTDAVGGFGEDIAGSEPR